MAGTISFYDHMGDLLGEAGLDWPDDTINLMLVTSTYSFNSAHTEKSQITNELAAGSGYSTGGIALANKSLTVDVGAKRLLVADNPVFNFTGSVTFRGGVVYKSGSVTIGSGTLTDPVLLYLLFDDTPADITTSTTYTVNIDSNTGFFRF